MFAIVDSSLIRKCFEIKRSTNFLIGSLRIGNNEIKEITKEQDEISNQT